MDTLSLASLFKSLSEPVRLRIMSLLLEHDELCVCELVDTLNLSQSVVSRHLAYLRNNQLVAAKREGAWMYYRISPQAQTDMATLFEFIKKTTQSNQQISADKSKLNLCKSSQCIN